MDAVKAQTAEMERALDDVEERLLGNQAMVHLWQELGRRHQSVTQVACQNLTTHAEAMVKHIDKQESKAKKLRRRRMQASRSEQVTAAPVKGRKSRSN